MDDPARPLRKRAARQFVAAHGLVVAEGPFAGMRYIEQAHGSAFCPKLVGSYEEELHGFLKSMGPSDFDTVIDVGSAEGYYVVGLARLLPAARILAFDIDPDANTSCLELAERNGVRERIEIKEACTPEVLASMDLRRALMIVDCEGYEETLLDLDKASSLSDATMLVEIHDCYVPGLSEELVRRFSPTHEIELVHTRERDVTRYKSLLALSPYLRRWAVDERRKPSKGVSNYGIFRPRR